MTDGLVFGVTLSADDKTHREALGTLSELLSADSGLAVETHNLRRPNLLARALAMGDVDIGWLSPTLLLMDPGLSHVVPLLSSVRQGAAAFHALLFSSTRLDAESIDELHGAHVAWVAPSSAAGYLVPRLSLSRRGYDLGDLFAEETFYDTHGKVARAVLRGKADVGATYGHFAGGSADMGKLMSAGFMEHGPFASVRVLDVSGPIPADMIVVRPEVPIPERIAFAAALSRLAHDPVGGEPLRRVIGAEDFRAVTTEALSELQSLMQAAQDV